MVEISICIEKHLICNLIEKNDSRRKPLLLLGARQTGKTYLIKEFASKFYECMVEVNFERDKSVSSFFEDSLNPRSIIIKLENYYGKRILPGSTLIFFDEIQACESAITALKYFNEEANEYHVICAGSLLGVVINRKKFSYPVGKVQELRLYPMDFEEYLIALGEELLIKTIRNCYENNAMMDETLHKNA